MERTGSDLNQSLEFRNPRENTPFASNFALLMENIRVLIRKIWFTGMENVPRIPVKLRVLEE